MSQQLQITGGAKVRNLEGVITGTVGVLNSLPINGSNGIPQLDVNGKILVSQLPNSVMEYKGTWNVSTNTPTLVNGTGNQGDVYLVTGAATNGTNFNFGAGNILFFNGDQVIYSGTIWQRASGATGSVTSVAVTETGDALTITGSPITTSGTINIGFAGTAAQYVAGNGSLITFPTIISQAQNLVSEVYNKSGATITKGTVIYINGGQGNLPAIAKALATGDATSAQTYGVVQDDITNMNNGYVVVAGRLQNIDTQAYTEGTQLYLSSTTAGAWTSTKQYAPAHLVYVGIVVRSHPTQGIVEIKIQNGYELDELHNVSAQTPTNNQGLFYNSSNSLWENKSIATALGYTPANDTLVVKLAGTQSITGFKIFTGGAQFTNSATLFESGIALNNTASPTFNNGYTVLGANADGLQINLPGGIYNNFKFASTSVANNYTFPNASGTIALTSNIPSLSGYVQGTGTINYLPKFTGTSTIGNSSIVDDGSAVSTYTNAFRVLQPDGTGAAFYLSGNSTQATMSAITSSGAYQDLAISGATLTFFSGTLGSLGSSLAMTINPSGNVSIGNSNNTFKLDVTGTGRFTGALTVGSRVLASGGSTNAFSGNNNSGSEATMYLTNANAAGWAVYSAQGINYFGGNVGIGTTIPTDITNYKALTINGTSGSFTEYQQGGSYAFRVGSDSSAGGFISQTDANPIRFFTNSGERMRITSGGDLCINNTFTVTSKLKVKSDGTTSGSYACTFWDSNAADLFYVRSDGYISTGTSTNSPCNATTSNAANMYVYTLNGALARSTSSLKYKTNVEDYSKGLAEVMQLRPVTYNGKSELDSNKTFAGLIAEEVHDLGLTEFVQYAEDGTPDALAYTHMIALLTKAIQEQQTQIESLKARLN